MERTIIREDELFDTVLAQANEIMAKLEIVPPPLPKEQEVSF